MVFGNLGNDSATGVCFTRNPSTGEKMFYGEFLINAQGEDVVAGLRTPQSISKDAAKGTGLISLEEAMPECFKQLTEIQKKLESYFRDMQDIEFTIEQGKLFMLQCRIGKRNGPAAVRMAVDMVKEKMISEMHAL